MNGNPQIVTLTYLHSHTCQLEGVEVILKVSVQDGAYFAPPFHCVETGQVLEYLGAGDREDTND